MQKKNNLFKLTLLSISLMLMSAGAISASIPFIKESFPDISGTMVESLITLPSFTVMIFVLLSGFISKKIGSKKTVLLGLLLVLIGGVAPAFINNFTFICISRLVFGAGLGIFNSLAVSLIHVYFEGDERTKMIGYQSAFQSLGSSLTTFIAGILLPISWQSSFLIYFLALPIFLLFIFVVPENNQKVTYYESNPPQKQRANASVFFSAGILFFMMVLVMVIVTKVGSFVFEQGMADTNFLGISFTLMTFSGFLSGITYGKVYSILRVYTPVFGAAISTIGMISISFTTNIYLMTVFLIVVGYFSNLMIPYVFGSLMDSVEPGSETLVVSLGMVGANLGSFASPYIIGAIGSIFGNSSAKFSLIVSGIGFAIMAAIFYIKIKKKVNMIEIKAVV